MLKTIATTDVEHVYRACARIAGRRPTELTPHAIAATMVGLTWVPLPDWESMADAEVAMRSGLYAAPLAGVLLAVTEASLASRIGAFELDAGELGVLVSQHLSRFGECFFNGDVIVVERDGGHIWLFHHEGQYTLAS
jgi:hypothetical protein